MKKSKAMQLVKALRKGGYKQSTHQLVNNNDEFCCLGVACNISKQPLEWEEVEGVWFMGKAWGALPKEIQEEFGFYSDVGRRRDGKDIVINGTTYSSLARANDGGCTFEQIADYIEKNWEML